MIKCVLGSQNRRVGKRVNGIMTRMYIYQSQTQIAAELDGQGKLINRYVYGTKANSPDYVVSNEQVIKVVSDQVGTPRAFIDAMNGAIISKTHFDEFGIKSTLAASAATELDSIGYAGGLLDADTGLTHFGAREYSAEIGKWMSKDPIGFSGGDTNLFGYVLSDPVNFVDSNGKTAQDVQNAINFIQANDPNYVSHGISYFNGQGLDGFANLLTGNLELNNAFLGILDNDDKLLLLNTLYHENLHFKDGFVGTLIGLFNGRHKDIYDQSKAFSQACEASYLNLYGGK
jgi:RHS repeat-associated protein